jgi:hypothetical protein
MQLKNFYKQKIKDFPISYKKKQWRPPSKKKRGNRENPMGLSPRNREVCHSIGTALLQSIAKMGTQSNMKSSRKTLQELSLHIPQIPS